MMEQQPAAGTPAGSRAKARNHATGDRWYVAFRHSHLPGGVYVRTTRTFKTENEAKRFAGARLQEGCDVSAGTINPHLPKMTLGLSQISAWLDGDR